MKTTIDMAREAGAMFDHMMWIERDLLPVFQRFEALVRADEREECAKMVEDLNEIGHSYGLENRIRARGNT